VLAQLQQLREVRDREIALGAESPDRQQQLVLVGGETLLTSRVLG
jgi:hypothetical protein